MFLLPHPYSIPSTRSVARCGTLITTALLAYLLPQTTEANPGVDWALIIIGHAPVAYSGQLAIRRP